MTSSLLNPTVHTEISKDWFPARAAAALQGKSGVIPSIAVIEDGPVRMEFSINGFPLSNGGTLRLDDGRSGDLETDYLRIAPVHPYFLQTGANTLQTAYHLDAGNVAEGESGPFRGRAAITRWDYVDAASNTEIVRFATPELTAQSGEQGVAIVSTPFEFDGTLPTWRWTESATIEPGEDTHTALRGEVEALHRRIGSLCESPDDADAAAQLAGALAEVTSSFVTACELRGKPYRLIDQIVEAATAQALPGNPRGSLAWRGLPPADELELVVFARGKLARLRTASDAPFLAFWSTLADGPRGRPGGAVLAFDAWFRRSPAGAWELDALLPRTAPGTWSQFQLSGDERRELFILTGF